MTPWRIVSHIITSILLTFSIALVVNHLMPKWKKKWENAESNAKNEKTVKIGKRFKRLMLTLAIFLDLVGIFIVAFPKIITNFFGFNYLVTILVWWIPITFDNIFLFLLLTEA